MEIEKGKIFTIEKGNRKARWKVIDHPYFDNGAIAIIRDYNGMRSVEQESDYNHIVHGGTIEKAYQAAYDMT